MQNNLTYVISPGFPNLIDWPMNCSVVVRKIDRQVSQLRIDFVHFNIVSQRSFVILCSTNGILTPVIQRVRDFTRHAFSTRVPVFHLLATLPRFTLPFSLHAKNEARRVKGHASRILFLCTCTCVLVSVWKC